MGWINDRNREMYIKRMATHFSKTMTEEEVREMVEKQPEALEEFVDYLVDNSMGDR
jgi:hypothetical protein